MDMLKKRGNATRVHHGIYCTIIRRSRSPGHAVEVISPRPRDIANISPVQNVMAILIRCYFSFHTSFPVLMVGR